VRWPFTRRQTQKWLTISWGILIVPSVIWWKHSVPWLVFMSVWANFASHWGAYEGTRPPEDQDDERP
jgi:hypothetical protein